jgi:hypothetical protein
VDDDEDDDDAGAHGEGKFDHDGWVNNNMGRGSRNNNQIVIPIPASVPPQRRGSPPTFAPPPHRDPPPPMQPTARPPMSPAPGLFSGLGAPGLTSAGGMRSPTGMPVFMPTPRPPVPDTAK